MPADVGVELDLMAGYSYGNTPKPSGRGRFGVHYLHIEKDGPDDLFVYLVCPHAVPDVLEPNSEGVHVAEHPCSLVLNQGPDAGYWMPRLTVDIEGPCCPHDSDVVQPGPGRAWTRIPKAGCAAYLQINVMAPTFCVVLWETSQIGVMEMMGGTLLRDDWPTGWPKTPGVYEVFMDSDGWGEDYSPWLELVDQSLMEDA